MNEPMPTDKPKKIYKYTYSKEYKREHNKKYYQKHKEQILAKYREGKREKAIPKYIKVEIIESF